MLLDVALQPELESVRKVKTWPFVNSKTSNIMNVRSDEISFQAAMKTLFHSLRQIRHRVFQSTWNKLYFPKHRTFLQTANSLTNQPSRNKVKWWIQPGLLAATFKFPAKTMKKKIGINCTLAFPNWKTQAQNEAFVPWCGFFSVLCRCAADFPFILEYWICIEEERKLWSAKLNFIHQLWSCPLKQISVPFDTCKTQQQLKPWTY